MPVGLEGVQVVSLSLGYVMGQALHAAAQLGVADAIAAGAADLDTIAAATGSHGPSLSRLLRTLAAGGIVAEDRNGNYSLTTLGETLRSDVPGSVRAAVIWVGEPMHYGTCGRLADSVRAGSPVFEPMFGCTYFDHLARDPEASRVWDEGMACFSNMENAPIAQAYQFRRAARVVDVGGGQGGFLAEVLELDPSLRGVLFDRDDVVASPRAIEERGFSSRCEFVGGDFFETLPEGGDYYVFKRVLHDWDDETCVELLRRCRKVIAPEGRLLVIDAVIPPGNDPHPAKIVDLVMMGILRGRERTEGEFSELLAAAGFTLTRVVPTHSMLAIVEGAAV